MTESGPRIDKLAGYTIGITAARRSEELGAALERRGAKVLYAPAIRIVPLADDSELRAATARCLEAPLDIVIATTGIGFRGWMDAADTWGIVDDLTEALGAATILARGPKARGAVRACGLRESWAPESESSSEVLAHVISTYDLDGCRIAVQLHGEPLPDLVQTLRMAGADVIEVPVYRWVLPEDVGPLRRLVDSLPTRGVDAIAFTSAPAVVSFLRAVDESDDPAAVRATLSEDVLLACVGPVTAGPFVREGIPCIQPDRARLGALVRELVEQVPHRCGQVLPVAGRTLEIRGHAVAVGGELIPLTGVALGLLRALSEVPGRVVSRAELLRLLPGSGADEHAIEVAIGRLRSRLGDQRMIQTVVKRGYRLAFEPEQADDEWRY